MFVYSFWHNSRTWRIAVTTIDLLVTHWPSGDRNVSQSENGSKIAPILKIDITEVEIEAGSRIPYYKSLNRHISTKTHTIFDRIWYTTAYLELGDGQMTKYEHFTARRVCIARTERCLSISLSVHSVRPHVCLTHAGILSNGYTYPQSFFLPSGSPTVLVFPCQTSCHYSSFQ